MNSEDVSFMKNLLLPVKKTDRKDKDVLVVGMTKFNINVSIEPHYPLKTASIRDIVRKALEIARVVGEIEVSIVIIGDRKMRALNKEYRGLDETTDVLSFSFTEGPMPPNSKNSKSLYLGDIFISYPQLLNNAAQYNKMVDEELALLLAHAILHLLGYEHERTADEEKKMKEMEERILSSLSV